MMRVGWVFLLLIMLAGCATTQAYYDTVNSWVGVNANNLVASNWGVPDTEISLPNGNKAYCYKSSSFMSTPIYNAGYYPGFIQGGQIYEVWCNTCFEVNSKGTIVNVSSKGNNCVLGNNSPLRYSGIPVTAR